MLLTLLAAATLSAGTIQLPVGPYCATTQTAGVYNGVTAGQCASVPPIDPPGRQVVGSIKYPNAPGSGVRGGMDLKKWGSLFGHLNSTDAEQPWPGPHNTAPAITAFTGAGYVASCFTPTVKAQVTVRTASYYGWEMDGAWSTRPGDFSGSVTGSLPSACAGTAGPGNAFPKMSTDPALPGCYFAVGTPQVCLNLRMHTPMVTSPTAGFTSAW